MLVAATALNLATFAPPWMVTLPGLRFRQAFAMTQASTALSIVAPGGAAIGMAGSWGMLRAWGFRSGDVTRAITLTGVWNQLANLVFPVVALFLLKVNGGETALLGTAAFVGVAVLGVVVALLVLVLYSDELAREVGDAVARFVSWALARIRPQARSTWGGASFARFRDEAVDLLARRWHVLTLATFAGSLTVFLLLVLSLRAVGVPASRGRRRRGLRRLVARPHHRRDPDHARRLRHRRARPDDGARRLRRRQRGRRGGGPRSTASSPSCRRSCSAGLAALTWRSHRTPVSAVERPGGDAAGDGERGAREGAEPQERDAGRAARRLRAAARPARRRVRPIEPAASCSRSSAAEPARPPTLRRSLRLDRYRAASRAAARGRRALAADSRSASRFAVLCRLRDGAPDLARREPRRPGMGSGFLLVVNPLLVTLFQLRLTRRVAGFPAARSGPWRCC